MFISSSLSILLAWNCSSWSYDPLYLCGVSRNLFSFLILLIWLFSLIFLDESGARVCVCVCESHSCIWLFATATSLHCPWNYPGKNTGEFPSPGALPNQGLNLGLLHCGQILYHLSHQVLSLFVYLFKDLAFSFIDLCNCFLCFYLFLLDLNDFFPSANFRFCLFSFLWLL